MKLMKLIVHLVTLVSIFALYSTAKRSTMMVVKDGIEVMVACNGDPYCSEQPYVECW